MKFNTFLHSNEHTERICLYLTRQFDAVPSKIRYFQISKSIFEAKNDSIFLKPKYSCEYQVRRTTFIQTFYTSTILLKLYLVKMCSIFVSSASNCLTRYNHILSGSLFGCKNALNLTRLPMKFHNCVHTSGYFCLFH